MPLKIAREFNRIIFTSKLLSIFKSRGEGIGEILVKEYKLAVRK